MPIPAGNTCTDRATVVGLGAGSCTEGRSVGCQDNMQYLNNCFVYNNLSKGSERYGSQCFGEVLSNAANREEAWSHENLVNMKMDVIFSCYRFQTRLFQQPHRLRPLTC